VLNALVPELFFAFTRQKYLLLWFSALTRRDVPVMVESLTANVPNNESEAT
jgi:hypothetical protein